jgi:type IV pilus biogenesis protein CpaD/CtpE
MNYLAWVFSRGVWSSPSRYVDPTKPTDTRTRHWIVTVTKDGTFDISESNTALLAHCRGLTGSYAFHDRLEPLLAKIQLIEDDITSG